MLTKKYITMVINMLLIRPAHSIKPTLQQCYRPM